MIRLQWSFSGPTALKNCRDVLLRLPIASSGRWLQIPSISSGGRVVKLGMVKLERLRMVGV